MTTIVTALYDINRENKGDGRQFDDYLKWLPDTLSLETNYVIFTEQKIVDVIPKKDNIKIIVSEIPLSYLKNEIESILLDKNYISRIKNPNRVECVLPMYNIIQYSKFEWLKRVITENPFNSSHFFWMDAGCSRFFNGLSGRYPNKLPKKFLIQGNINTNIIQIDDNYKWKSDCVLVGTFFGGEKQHVLKVSEKVLLFLLDDMISKKMINNEQITLAYIQKTNPDLFDVYIKLNSGHLPILQILK